MVPMSFRPLRLPVPELPLSRDASSFDEDTNAAPYPESLMVLLVKVGGVSRKSATP